MQAQPHPASDRPRHGLRINDIIDNQVVWVHQLIAAFESRSGPGRITSSRMFAVSGGANAGLGEDATRLKPLVLSCSSN